MTNKNQTAFKKYMKKYDKKRYKNKKRKKQVLIAQNRFKIRHPRSHYYLKRLYGITLQDKERMYKEQNGLCKACGNPLPEDFHRAHVDHVHGTKIVRGLLHHWCNMVLGYEERNPGVLARVIKFAKRWKS